MVTLLTSDNGDGAPTMTTTAAEYTSLPQRLSALSLDPSPTPDAVAAAAADGGTDAGDRSAAAPQPPRKAWKSPPRRPPNAVMDEPCSSWPLLSRDAPSGKKSHQGASSPASLTSGGAPAMPVICTDQEDQEQPQISDQTVLDALASPVDVNPRTALPPPLLPDPPQQQMRPPFQNPPKRRHRLNYHQRYQNNYRNGSNNNNNNNHHNGNGYGNRNSYYGGGQHYHRPRYRQEAEMIVNNYNGFYQQHGRPMEFYSFPPHLPFNPVQGPHWGPNPPVDPPYIGTFLPPQEYMYHDGYYPGPYVHDVLPFGPPILPPPIRAPPLPVAGRVVESHSPNGPLPPAPLPTVAALQPMGNFQCEDEDLNARLRRQIEYYFSDENLLKDGYLKRCMDSQGWVGIHIIAGFPRVKSLTEDRGVIIEALKSSATIEVSVDKMRRKREWIKWIRLQ